MTEEFGTELITKAREKQGHVGTKQLILTITKKFYFKNMYKHIKIICHACETCIKNKTRSILHKAPYSQLGPAEKPFEIVSLDTIGGFSSKGSTKKYLHLIIDHFTRYAYIATSKTQGANDFNESNQTLVNRLRCEIYKSKNRAWSVLAQECVNEYNNTVHSSTDLHRDTYLQV